MSIMVRRSGRKVKQVEYIEGEDSDSGSESEYEEVKRRKIKSRPPKSTGRTVSDTFIENQLYQSLSNPEASIDELAIQWIEDYEKDEENDENLAITELINLILRCCGCLHLFQPHDLVNLESAGDTVAELVIVFEDQGTHEYPFVSNHKDSRFFKTNVLEFFEKLTSICHNKELLYKSFEHSEESLSSPLITKVFTWLLSLSICTIRPLRYISTLILMKIQTELTLIAKEICENIEITQNQLTNSKKSKRSKQERIAIIDTNLKRLNHQKSTIIEYFNDITQSTFVNRYRDIDPLIRQECMAALSDWMINFPEFFFQSTYLRHIGWLLSDPNNKVRSEASKSLLKLYKHTNGENIMDSGFRQFTERFKPSIFKICYNDNEPSVRTNLLQVLGELFKLEYLSYDECITVISTFFQLIKYGTDFSKSNQEKMVQEVGKFINIVNIGRFQQLKDQFDGLMACEGFDVNEGLKFNTLIEIFKHASSSVEQMSIKVHENYPVVAIFKTLYPLAFYHKSWEFIIKYLLVDIDGIEMDPELREILDLDTIDKGFLLQIFHGSLKFMVNRKKADNEIDDIKNFLPKLMPDLNQLLSVVTKNDGLLDVFISIWNTILGDVNNIHNVYATFQGENVVDLYNKINTSILRVLKGDVVFDNVDHFLKVMFSGYMTSEIKNCADEVLKSLVDICNSGLESSSPFSKLVDPLSKINTLGSFTDITDYVEQSSTEVLPVIDVVKLRIDELDFNTSTSENLNQMNEFFKQFLDTVLIVSSSKLETLIGTENQSFFDINRMFDNYNEIFDTLLKLFGDADVLVEEYVNDSSREEYVNELNQFRTIVMIKLIDLVVGLRRFFMKFNNSNSFQHFNEFFNNHKTLSTLVKDIPVQFQNKLMSLFVLKEKKLMSIELEDYNESRHEGQLENARAAQKAYEMKNSADNDLIVYTVKLFGLLNEGLVDESVLDRIKLNKDSIGGFYRTIVQRYEDKLARVEPEVRSADNQAVSTVQSTDPPIQPTQDNSDSYQ
ncbi:hypothetical protein CLIB1444_03S06524 [[Candida] jaroonii]|uniref:Uncharacterized protein n=1 Tax=[Candida] jaroonii TaxID=467808 RepID=A0ACA9Y5B7_9ASCO|nr:hypothetical protein CLIB1444_03S06524 [[Candida] jaroonii]